MAKKKEAAKPAVQTLTPITTDPNPDELAKGFGPSYRPAYPLTPQAQPFGPAVATSALNAIVSGLSGTAGPFTERGLYGGVTSAQPSAKPLISIGERNSQLRTGTKIWGDEDTHIIQGAVTGMLESDAAEGKIKSRSRGGAGGVQGKERRERTVIENEAESRKFGPAFTHFPVSSPEMERSIERGDAAGPPVPKKMRPLTTKERFTAARNYSRLEAFVGQTIPSLMRNPDASSNATSLPRWPLVGAEARKSRPVETRRMPFKDMTPEGQANVVASALRVGLGGTPFPQNPAKSTATSTSKTHVLVDPRKR